MLGLPLRNLATDLVLIGERALGLPSGRSVFHANSWSIFGKRRLLKGDKNILDRKDKNILTEKIKISSTEKIKISSTVKIKIS